MDQGQGRDRQRLQPAHPGDQRREHLAAVLGVGAGEDVDVGAAGEDLALGAPDQRPGVGLLDFGDPRLERFEGLAARTG